MRTLIALLFGFLAPPHAGAEPPSDGAAATTETTAYDFAFTRIDGSPLPLDVYRGKTLLVANTASLCGFTPQYDGLQALYDQYRDDGLVVIGAPSDNFGGQEYADNGKIRKFCETNFNITFPLTEKIDVKGAAAHPFFRWAKDELGASAEPKWNFHKILIDRSGNAVAAFPSSDEPLGGAIEAAVQAALADASPGGRRAGR